jgi:CRP-like cAMP-binding protein
MSSTSIKSTQAAPHVRPVLKRTASPSSIGLALDDLMHHLALKRPPTDVDDEAALPCVSRPVRPGEVICKAGEPCTDVFLVLHGVAMHEPGHGDTGHASTLRLSGAQELLQWQATASRYSETVSALTAMRLMAIPRSAILASKRFRDFFEYALSMRGTAAVLRELRFRHALSELDTEDRLIAGLKHIVALAGCASDQRPMKVHVPLGTMAAWLGMDACDVRQLADKPSMSAWFNVSGDAIVALNPSGAAGAGSEPQRPRAAHLVRLEDPMPADPRFPCSRPPEQ